MSDKNNHTVGKDTLLSSLGTEEAHAHGVVNPPVYHASTVVFDTWADLRDGVRHMDEKFFYGRFGSPTTRSLEQALAGLEGGVGARLFPSGIAAVIGAILSVCRNGDHILICDNAYEPTRKYATGFLKTLGIDADYYDPAIGGDIKTKFKDNTTAVLNESPGSLTFEVADVPAMAAAAHERDIYLILDNTWATGYFSSGIELGADLVIQACTKYIVGHADVMMGAVIANDRSMAKLAKTRIHMGQTVGPDDAYLTLRGLRTLGVRLKQHQENALKVAHWLEGRDDVHKVCYPALKGAAGHDLWKRDFSGASGLFSIVLAGGKLADIGTMVDDMQLFKLGLSWGGFESLIYPSDPSRARDVNKWDAPGPLVRLHIGLENTEDIIADLEAALNRFRTTY